MKRLLAAAAAVALLAPAGAFAQAKERATIGMQQEPSSLDPTSDATASIDTIFNGNVFETLTTVDQQATVVPYLAKSWEIAPDGLAYTFRLHEGAAFTDGTALTSATVKFAFERAMAPESVNPTKALFKPIDSIETPDPATVVIKLKSPDNLFLFSMSRGDAAIVAPASAETNKTRPVGSGPYRFKEWVKGDRLVLELNPQNRLAGSARLKQVTYKFVTDPAAATAALLAGDIDAFPNVPAVESAAQFASDKRFVVAEGSTEGEVILAMNNARKPLDDVRVRHAIQHAIDRSLLVEGAMFGYGTPIGSFFPPHHAAYEDLTGRYGFDPAKAKKLLEEAGAIGASLSLEPPPFPYARRSAEIIAQMLGDVGLKVQVKNVEWPYWIGEVYKKKNYDLTIVAHVEPNDYGNFARGKDYYWSYENPEMSALIERIRKSTVPAETTDLLKRFQRLAADDAPVAYLFQLPQVGIYKAGLKGYWTNAAGGATTPLVAMYWE